MAENNQTNDITEMLMRLRASVENDRAKAESGKAQRAETASEKKSDDGFEAYMQEFEKEIKALEAKEKESVRAAEETAVEDDEDPWYEGDPEEGEEEPEEEDLDIEIATEEEREAEEDDEDPWFVKSEEEPTEIEEIEEEDEPEEDFEVEIVETPIEEEDEPEEDFEVEIVETPIEEEDEPEEDFEVEIVETPIEEEDDTLTPEMISEAEAEEEAEETEDENLPSWYQTETEKIAPAERSDDLDDEEGETFFDFDDWGYADPPTEPEETDETEDEVEETDETEDEPVEETAEEIIDEFIGEMTEEEYGEEYLEYAEEPKEETAPLSAPDRIEAEINRLEEEKRQLELVRRRLREELAALDKENETLKREQDRLDMERKALELELAEEKYSEEDDDSLESELDEIEEADEVVLDETDFEFLHQIGYSAVEGSEEVVKQSVEESAYVREHPGDVAFDNDGEEYVTVKQSGVIRSEYAFQKKGALIRLAIAGGAAVLLLIYELLGGLLPGMLNPELYPFSHAMISLQLLVIAAATSIRMLAKGAADLCSLRVTPYSVISASVALNVVYTVVIAIVQPGSYALYNFCAVMAVLFGLAYEYVMLLNEERAFNAINTSRGACYALCDDDAGEKPLGDEPAFRAYGTDFNKNFFTHIGRPAAEYKYLTKLILGAVTAATLVLAVVWIVTGNGGEGAKGAMLTVNLALPLGVLGAYSLPMMGALRSLEGKGAVIGHAAADKYSSARFVTFDETDLFPSMKTTHPDLKPAGNLEINEILKKTGRLFSAIGGPIRKMVEITDEGDDEGSVEIVGIFDDGVSAVVDSSAMLAGSAAFMQMNGVDVGESSDYRDKDEANEILYVAIDGKLATRYYIKYLPDEDFVRTVNMLGDKGISVGIRTRNPGVNSKIIERRCPELKYKVYTIKSVSDEERDLVSHMASTDSGIIAYGKAAQLAEPLLAAISLKKFYKIDTIMRIVSACLGGATVVAFAIMGKLSDIGSLPVTLYQLLWLIPGAAMLLKFKKKK